MGALHLRESDVHVWGNNPQLDTFLCVCVNIGVQSSLAVAVWSNNVDGGSYIYITTVGGFAAVWEGGMLVTGNTKESPSQQFDAAVPLR